MIKARVLGPVSLEVNGGPPPPELLWRKHLALLLYLARSPKRGRTREHLAALLWPDKEESAARHSLNEALRVIRRVAGDAAIETSGGQIRLAPGGKAVQLDAEQLDSLIAARSWAGAAEIVVGCFLEGFAVPDSGEFEDWLATERRYWNDLAVRALLGYSAELLRAGRAADALSAARRAENLEPYSDLVARAIMTAAALQGDVAMAAAHYERFAGQLQAGLGSEPASETRALLARIRNARAPGPRAPSQPEARRRRAPLVGRAAELAGMLAIWERGRGGAGATAIVLSGDAGSGKSRLLEEFLGRVRLDGGTVALVRAVLGDGAEEGRGWLGLARGGLLDAPGLASASPQALAPLAASLPLWAERFPRAARDGQTGLPLGQAMTAVLEAGLSEAPLVLAVDDAQWLDRTSLLGLLAGLRDFSRAPLCLVLAALPVPPRDELDELRRRVGHDLIGATVGLSPLDPDALRSLARWALPGYDPPALERVCRRVASDSAGLPLLAVELFAGIADGLDLQQGHSAWPAEFHTLTETLPGNLPDTVVAALRINYRRLTSSAQRVLAAAAVIGENGRVDEPRLRRLVDMDDRELQAGLDELEWERWLEADGQGYGFVARLAREVVARDMITKGQAARLRERLAQHSPA